MKVEVERRVAEALASRQPAAAARAEAAPVPAQTREEEAAKLKQIEAQWKVKEMERLKAERVRWEAEAEQRLQETEEQWKIAENKRMAEAMAQWRSDTDRLAHNKMRMAAETMRQRSEDGESLLSRIPFKLIFVLLLLAALVGGGVYAYKNGMFDQVLASLTAPAPTPEQTPPVAAAAPAPQPQPTTQPQWVVTVEYSNVRAAPSTDSAIVGNVRRDMVVTEIGHEGNWIQVQLPGADRVEGWINSRMLKQQAPAPTQ